MRVRRASNPYVGGPTPGRPTGCGSPLTVNDNVARVCARARSASGCAWAVTSWAAVAPAPHTAPIRNARTAQRIASTTVRASESSAGAAACVLPSRVARPRHRRPGVRLRRDTPQPVDGDRGDPDENAAQQRARREPDRARRAGMECSDGGQPCARGHTGQAYVRPTRRGHTVTRSLISANFASPMPDTLRNSSTLRNAPCWVR